LKEHRTSVLKPRRTKILFFGNFSVGNFGNEATLEAIHSDLHRLMPEAEFACICNFPAIASATHNVAAFPISPNVITAWAPQRACRPLVGIEVS